MSYIQVEIGGKMRNLRYGNATDIEIKEKMAGVKNHIILGYIVIWAGLYIAAIVDDSPVDFTFKDVCDWAEKMKAEDVLKITECYKSTINFPIDKKSTDKEVKIKNYKAHCLEIAFGKLGWSRKDYYTSSPQEFYYACKGYFDKENERNKVLRFVALFASQRSSREFNDFWPLHEEESDEKEVPSFAASSINLRNEILEKQRKQNAAIRDNS